MVALADDDAFKGDANAPVTIVEFSDFECPFCGRFYSQTLGQIESEYIDTGKVKFVYRDYPLDFHPNAQKAAEAKAKKEREESEAAAKKEAEAKAKVEAELQATKDAEAKALKDAEESKKQAALAPDKEKLTELISHIRSIEIPELATDKASEITKGVSNLLDKVVSYIESKSKEL